MSGGARVRDPGAVRRRRALFWLAWSLAGISVALFFANLALYSLLQFPRSPGEGITAIGDLLFFAPYLAFPLVGALVATRRPRNPVGWICLADGLLWMVMNASDYYFRYGVTRPGSVAYPVAVGTLANQWLWVPTIGLLGIYLVLLFPDGKLPSRRWRPFAWFSGAAILVLSLTAGFAPGPLENQGGVPNPFGLETLPWLEDLSVILLPLLPLCILASAVSMVLRFRRAGPEERLQIKWVAFFAAFAGVTYAGALLGAFILLPQLLGSGTPEVPGWIDLLVSVAVLGFAGIPVAIGIAVLKYRLYAIDLVINRTLVYGSLTLTLVATYVGAVVVLQRLFVALTGQGSTLAVVGSTLLIAALFNPLRRTLQVFVDRRFYRGKYDARKTLEALSARLRDETDLDALGEEAVEVVKETMQPAHVSLWLRPESARDAPG